ncbi:MAG: winged helix-turn-helix transcriptional regulator [Candidatus Heimdallarchaeota archaeon]|nr:winged helix-turn-helix transcriptional regulator [Candidatus Heimdallarchaeota archaeon]
MDLRMFTHEKRIWIHQLLSMHGELSLAEMSALMGASKTAIHHHLKILIETGKVEEARSEKARGSIDTKYFRLVPSPFSFTVEDILNLPEEEKKQGMISMVDSLESVFTSLEKQIGIVLDYYRSLRERLVKSESGELSGLETQLIDNNAHLRYIALDDKAYKQYLSIRKKLLAEIKNLKSNSKSSTNIVCLIDVPLGNIMESLMENRKD